MQYIRNKCALMGSDGIVKRRDLSGLFRMLGIACSLCVIMYLMTSQRGDSMPERMLRLRTLYGINDSAERDQHFLQPVVLTRPETVKSYSESAVRYDNLLAILKRWNPDIADLPPTFTETLQHFNYSCPAEREVAAQFMEAEMPFKLYGVPEFDAVSKLWTDEYLIHNLKNGRVERSATNHFMFWNANLKNSKKDYKNPTDVVKMSFAEFLKRAHSADSSALASEEEHFYFGTGVPEQDKKTFIGQDLSLFSTTENNFFIRDTRKNKGIQCRFGMRGVSAAAHYDAGRNMVVVLRGQRRYILAAPDACSRLSIITDKRHPSYRHSVLDWSSIPQAEASQFDQVRAMDTIMSPGEVLYIPSYWFHYVMSVGYSVQCNSRHGSPSGDFGKSDIDKCLKQ